MNNYLIEHFSFSGVNSFSRNEKAFEMQYIYRIPFKQSASSVAGSAYHAALEDYFVALQNGLSIDAAMCEMRAFDYIDSVDSSKWKIQKTTPTVEDCIKEASKKSSSLIHNFFSEVSCYIEDLKEVVAVELRLKEFIKVNGVDIPIPCKMAIDLVIKTKDGKTILIDHKSKKSFSNEKELALSIGKQSMTYVLGYEAHTDEKVDEVWFIENKYSKNKNGSPQLNVFKVEMTNDTRKLYQSLLYEPLRRMLEAVSNPDYVYMINDSDNFIDQAEMYEFWSKTMIAEVDDFPNIPDSKKDLISKRLKKIRDAKVAVVDPKIIKNFQKNAASFITYDLTNKDMTNSEKIEHILRSFGVITKVEKTFSGYSSDTYLLSMSAGVKISSVNKYKLDIAGVLGVPNVRIQSNLIVVDGVSYLAIESQKTRDKALLFDSKYVDGLKIPIGIDNFGSTVCWDMNNHSTPHVLMCGATGSGKSVSIVSIIEFSMLAGVNDVIIFDPKHEFTAYKNKGVKVYNDIEDIEKQMKLLVEDMEDRVQTGRNSKTLILFDEFADAVANSRKGAKLDIKELVKVGNYKYGSPKMKLEKVGTLKSLEENLKILLQKGRSLGFRIVAATQRASVKVISGDAKVNFPVQICFRVPKEQDSRVVLDEPGAESLAGGGDGLMKSPEYLNVVRFQGFFKQ